MLARPRSPRAEAGRAHGPIARERVGELQRARILAAMTELVREQGVAGVTVAHVVARSGVSRRTFYELFADREACLLAAFEHALERASEAVLPASRVSGSATSPGERWAERIRSGLSAFLGFLDEEPRMGGLCVVDALAAGREVLELRTRVVDRLINAVHQGSLAIRALEGAGRRPARIVAEGTVGAVLAVIHARMLEQDVPEQTHKPLVGLLNPLMGMIVLPYLGPELAGRELGRPAPRLRKRSLVHANPLRDLDMRLTYRTVRVLLAIAEQPAASSRQVADASGVTDQGQMSKLLWRLEHLGLIANAAHSKGRGEPNAWTLTVKGREVEQAIQSQTGR